uniref:glutathione transferase n=1 Tax=Culicoides sonorensis TaxID=179676 RepID=A0A336LR34_CULSO
MSPILYYLPEGPPTRGVLFLIRYLNLDVELKLCRTYMNEHKDPKYLKLNPCHTVPTLDDNGFVLIDSQAIAVYLAEQYGASSNLFGNSVKDRSSVLQRLFFNSTMFEQVKLILAPIIYGDVTKFEEKALAKIYEMLDCLEIFLTGQDFVAGSSLTIADFFLVNNVITFMHLKFDMDKYKHIKDWVQRMKVLTGFTECEEGAISLSKLVLPKLK